jgi:hypothetical protein
VTVARRNTSAQHTLADVDTVTKLINIGTDQKHRMAWVRSYLATGLVAVSCVHCAAFWSIPRTGQTAEMWATFYARARFPCGVWARKLVLPS